MRKKKPPNKLRANIVRLLTALALSSFAISTHAESCWDLYPKSGATPGTSSCRLDVASNTPSGMGSYGCRNDFVLIDAWCSTPGDPDDSCPVADPVYPASGKVTLTESDFRSGDAVPLTFARSYLSSPFLKSATAMGPVWLNNWQRQLNVTGASGSSPKIIAYRANGQPLTFLLTGGQWKTSAFSGLALSQSASGWILTDLTTDTVETFSAQGVLLAEKIHTGFTRTLTYDGAGRLTAITQRGAGAMPKYDLLTIKLDYDAQGRIYRMTDPSGELTQYGYDANNNLVSVTWPDGHVRQYVYDDARFKGALTGLVDESGSRVATWTYDERGRASAVSHPDTTRNVQFTYGNNSTTMSWGNESGTMNYASVAGMLRLTRGSAADGDESRTLDANGNLLQKTAPDGTAAYSYDSAGRPVRAAVASASGTVVTTVRYADATSLRPSLVASPGKMRAFVYDAYGNVTGYSEFDTTDATGVNGFEATSTDTKLTVGAVYDSNNRMSEATVYVNGIKTEYWWYFPDETGNLMSAQEHISHFLISEVERDAANRLTVVGGNSREGRFIYDKRGRVTRFVYKEDAIPLTAGVKRILTVDYTYTPDGRVANRTGTVAKNNEAAHAISADEINQWISNYEGGIEPVGPPVNLSGSRKSMTASVTLPITPVCPECYVFTKAKFAWKLFYREFSVTPAGRPIQGDVPELQIAAQEQIPFPILMPEQNGQSKRAMLYAQIFSGNGDSDSGFVKCSYGRPASKRCRDVRERCIDKCTTQYLPTPAANDGRNYHFCITRCLADNGC